MSRSKVFALLDLPRARDKKRAFDVKVRKGRIRRWAPDTQITGKASNGKDLD